jgi:hypothetical protein
VRAVIGLRLGAAAAEGADFSVSYVDAAPVDRGAEVATSRGRCGETSEKAGEVPVLWPAHESALAGHVMCHAPPSARG